MRITPERKELAKYGYYRWIALKILKKSITLDFYLEALYWLKKDFFSFEKNSRDLGPRQADTIFYEYMPEINFKKSKLAAFSSRT